MGVTTLIRLMKARGRSLVEILLIPLVKFEFKFNKQLKTFDPSLTCAAHFLEFFPLNFNMTKFEISFYYMTNPLDKANAYNWVCFELLSNTCYDIIPDCNSNSLKINKCFGTVHLLFWFYIRMWPDQSYVYAQKWKSILTTHPFIHSLSIPYKKTVIDRQVCFSR